MIDGAKVTRKIIERVIITVPIEHVVGEVFRWCESNGYRVSKGSIVTDRWGNKKYPLRMRYTAEKEIKGG